MYLWKKKKKRLLKAKQLNRAHMYSLQTQWMIFKFTYRTPTYNHLYPNHYHGNDQRSRHDLEEKKNRKKRDLITLQQVLKVNWIFFTIH